jgi:hypothetical protein
LNLVLVKDLDKDKKKLYELFVPQISNNYYLTYYNASNTRKNPCIGYLAMVTPYPIPDPDLVTGDKSSEAKKLDNAEMNIAKPEYKLGNIGSEVKITNRERKEIVYPAIYPYFDEHLKIIKYYILRTVIKNINDKLPTSTEKFTELSNRIRDVLGIDPTSNDRKIFYGMVIKIVDNIYTQFIKDCITLSVNNFTLTPGNTYNKPTLQVTAGTKLKLDFTVNYFTKYKGKIHLYIDGVKSSAWYLTTYLIYAFSSEIKRFHRKYYGQIIKFGTISKDSQLVLHGQSLTCSGDGNPIRTTYGDIIIGIPTMQRLENEPIKKIDFNRFWIGD